MIHYIMVFIIITDDNDSAEICINADRIRSCVRKAVDAPTIVTLDVMNSDSAPEIIHAKESPSKIRADISLKTSEEQANLLIMREAQEVSQTASPAQHDSLQDVFQPG